MRSKRQQLPLLPRRKGSARNKKQKSRGSASKRPLPQPRLRESALRKKLQPCRLRERLTQRMLLKSLRLPTTRLKSQRQLPRLPRVRQKPRRHRLLTQSSSLRRQ